MYIMVNGKRLKTTIRIKLADTVKFLSVPEDPGEVIGTIQMYRDDGFLLSEDNAADYARQKYSGTLLMLTNVPEPVPVEVEHVPSDTEVLNALLGVK